MKKSKGTIPLIKWIWQSYLKTVLVPLILVEFVFISIFALTNSWTRRELTERLTIEANEELTQIASLESSVIQHQLSDVTNTTQLYAEQIARALKTEAVLSPEDASRLAYSEDGAYYTTRDSAMGGAAIFYSGYVPIGEAERDKVARVLHMQELMKDIQLSHPLIASIYLNTYDSLNIIYPYFDVISQYSALMDIPSYNFYYEADTAHNPERSVQWTDVYLDPAGHGWMASSIAPVYNENFLEGVVGIDVTVDTITEQILKMEIPWEGYGILVSDDGTILALPEMGENDWGLSELTDHSYSEAIMEDTFKPEQFNLYSRESLSVFAQELTEESNGISTITLNEDKKIVSWDSIAETGWKLILIVPESNIYATVDRMNLHLNYIGLIIGGLILFYFIFFTALMKRVRSMSRTISQPLIEINSMVESIGNGDYYHETLGYPVAELDDTSHHLVKMGSQLGDANHELLKTQDALRDNESYLRVLIDSLDDVILEVDEFGNINKLRASDLRDIAINYTPNEKETIASIIKPEDAKNALAIIRRVIKTGKTEAAEYQLETLKGPRWYQARISLIKSSTKKAVISARDITDRIIMEQSLRLAKEDAEKASQTKSQFLSNMSHELRTPLNAVLGFAQLMEMNADEPLSTSQEEYVREIDKAGKHLLELINEILDLAKVESGKATISLESISVSDIMDETLAMIRPLAENTSITINCTDCENRQLYVQADYIRIKQVLINLLSNAIKYNKPNGKIDLFCERVDSKLRFHVMDTGIGIPADELNRIFEPFHRLSNTPQTVEGTGIGLAMVKQLMDMMGGTVFVESELGRGSHFCIELTLSGTNQKQPEAPLIDVTNIRKAGDKKIYQVLYVEDNPANLSLVEHILRPYPFINLMTATNAKDGLVIAEKNKLDLILLDINLPFMDGYELFIELKEMPRLSSAAIIAVSANAMEKDMNRALTMGFDAYLTKPIDVTKFTETVMKILFGQAQ